MLVCGGGKKKGGRRDGRAAGAAGVPLRGEVWRLEITEDRTEAKQGITGTMYFQNEL